MKRNHMAVIGSGLCLLLLICAFATAGDRAIVKKIPTLGEAGKRLALVIGNASYKTGPLNNPVNDARLMKTTLERLGFEVILAADKDKAGMFQAIRKFGERLKKSEVGLFYYAGHGIQVDGVNYLIPVNANIKHEDEVAYQAVNANLALAKMETAGNPLNIMILDACRNNPYARAWRSAQDGLAPMKAPEGTKILYATKPGSAAKDGDGNNSPFTESLVNAMTVPGRELEQVVKAVAFSVAEKTRRQQSIWQEGVVMGNFYFLADSGGTVLETPLPEPEPPKQSRLTVTANVPGATIQINGKPYGKAPKTFKIEASGTYTVKVSADGYMDYRQDAYIDIGKEITVSAILERIETKNTWVEPVTGMEFVLLKGGCYDMGCGNWTDNCDGDEKPVHEVCVDNFYLGRYEVTNAQYVIFLNSVKNHGTKDEPWFDTQAEDSDSRINYHSDKYTVIPGYEDHPVVEVSWYGARAFADWLSDKSGMKFRLPSEAEWEYACRNGGEKVKYPWGQDEPVCRKGAVNGAKFDDNNECDDTGTEVVGNYSKNKAGLFDMSGNVWEWCEDIYASGAYSKHSRSNPIYMEGGGSYRVIRGGSWYYKPANVRCAYRYFYSPAFRYNYVGFRLQRTF